MYFVQEVERRCWEAGDSDQTNDKCYSTPRTRLELFFSKLLQKSASELTRPLLMDLMQKKHLFAIRKMAQAHFSCYYHSQTEN